MATAQEQVLDLEEMKEKMAEDAKTVEAKALLQCMDTLHLGLSASAESIALDCFAKELIADDLYSGMFDGKWKPEYLRANYFIDCVYNKLKQFKCSNPAKVKTTISTLAKIIRRDCALEHIAVIVDGCNEPLDVKKASKKIAQGISTNLTPIALGAVAEDIITFSECQACTQADTSHEKRCMRIVLNSIFERVNFDGKNMDVFLKILKDNGKPISDYAIPIEKARKDLKSQQKQNGASKKETEETDDPTQDVKQTL